MLAPFIYPYICTQMSFVFVSKSYLRKHTFMPDLRWYKCIEPCVSKNHWQLEFWKPTQWINVFFLYFLAHGNLNIINNSMEPCWVGWEQSRSFKLDVIISPKPKTAWDWSKGECCQTAKVAAWIVNNLVSPLLHSFLLFKWSPHSFYALNSFNFPESQ